jgi:molybdopterin-containing oxidoreductase family iron-sulfur binding subunit
LADTPEFHQWVEREFPSGASELNDPVTRRQFVKIMSASFLLAGLGLTGCRRPEERVAPFSKAVENFVPGVPQYFATAYPIRNTVVPIVVKSYDGRPIKIEGNDSLSGWRGTDAFTQASLLNLYDPDRAMRFVEKGQTRTREQAMEMFANLSRQTSVSGGEGLAFLMEQTSSPTRHRLQPIIAAKYPKARWFNYEPVDFTASARATSLVFEKTVEPVFKLDAAQVIVSFDADFLGADDQGGLSLHQFAQGRHVRKSSDKLNRLYVLEALYSLTGANADHRLRIPASLIPSVMARFALEVFRQTRKFEELIPILTPIAQPAKEHEPWIVECARDFLSTPGAGLVLAGYRQPLAVQALAHLINAAAGGIGHTVWFRESSGSPSSGIQDLIALLQQSKVETLVILGGNPAYNVPAGLEFKSALRQARSVIRLGYWEDETYEACHWHVPAAHFLESWGDARTPDGTLLAIQPLVDPLFGGLTELEVLALIGGLEKVKPHDLVRETFQSIAGRDDDAWSKFLHDGFVNNSASQPVMVKPSSTAALEVFKQWAVPATLSPQHLELIFHRSYSVDDGRFNNNGWLQETPDPITKLTWDNAVLMSPKTAADLGINLLDEAAMGSKAEQGIFHSPVVEVELNGRKVRGPAWIQPGMADYVIGLALGYGREKTGRVGRLADSTPAGFNAYQVQNDLAAIAIGARINPVPGVKRQLACTQQHGSMEGRPLVREGNLEQFTRQPDFVHPMELDAPAHTVNIPKDAEGKPKTMYRSPKLEGMHQWGMVIDLTACVGCTACAVACQSENNIPLVGKDQVARGREMSWLRMDRYYSGDVHDPRITSQPVFCLHCENAPCENVCPVNATVHNDEGLNVMVYNRCVGTRYCSNNCPYKVRRFNFFDYNRRPLADLYRSPMGRNPSGEWELARWWNDPDQGTIPAGQWDLIKLARNPEVTVRMRGVMEKCTYCTQRIEQARIAQKVKARDSGNVRLSERERTIPQTACQQACPAGAIAFGDLADPASEVSQLRKASHNYSLLGHLDTRPRTTYLARIRNPNPAMPDQAGKEAHHA